MVQTVVVVNVVLLEQVGCLLEVTSQRQPLLVPVALYYLHTVKQRIGQGTKVRLHHSGGPKIV